MRKIYGIEFYERDGEGERIVFTKVLPNVPVEDGWTITERNELQKYINECDMEDIDRLCALRAISFSCDYWYPKNFYRIALVDWKYDV